MAVVIKDNSRVLLLTTGRMKLICTMMKIWEDRYSEEIRFRIVTGSKLREISIGSSSDDLRLKI